VAWLAVLPPLFELASLSVGDWGVVVAGLAGGVLAARSRLPSGPDSARPE